MKTSAQVYNYGQKLAQGLIEKVKKKWLYENFWQKELAKLKDYAGNIYDHDQAQRPEICDIFASFDDWASHYNGNG